MLRNMPHTVPRVGRSYEHFPNGFELHLLHKRDFKEVLGRSWGPEAGMSLIGTEESEVGGSV